MKTCPTTVGNNRGRLQCEQGQEASGVLEKGE